jgi:hypothetical protein
LCDCKARERLRVIADILVLRIRKISESIVVRCQEQVDQSGRRTDGQRTRPHAINQAEDGGIRADPYREAEHRHCGEARSPPQHPQRYAKVLY